MKIKPKIEIDLRKVETLAAQGLTNEEIADNLGIGYTTFYRRKNDLEGMEDAIKRGRSKGMAFVTNKLFELIKTGNITAIIFYLKTHGWTETQKIEATGKNGSPLIPSLNVHFLGATAEELEELKGV